MTFTFCVLLAMILLLDMILLCLRDILIDEDRPYNRIIYLIAAIIHTLFIIAVFTGGI